MKTLTNISAVLLLATVLTFNFFNSTPGPAVAEAGNTINTVTTLNTCQNYSASKVQFLMEGKGSPIASHLNSETNIIF